MKIFIAFLLAALVVGLSASRQQRRERFLLVFLACGVVAVALSSARWI